MEDHANVAELVDVADSKSVAKRHEGSTPSVGTTKKWVVHCKKEPFDVYIGRGRGSQWGNPFSHQEGTQARFKVDTREEAIARFREWLLSQPELVEKAKRELRGKVLGCWCSPRACHGDILARIANED